MLMAHECMNREKNVATYVARSQQHGQGSEEVLRCSTWDGRSMFVGWKVGPCRVPLWTNRLTNHVPPEANISVVLPATKQLEAT